MWLFSMRSERGGDGLSRHHDPMRRYETTCGDRSHGADVTTYRRNDNIARRSTAAGRNVFQQVTRNRPICPPMAGALDLYITPGDLKARRRTCERRRRRVEGTNYTV